MGWRARAAALVVVAASPACFYGWDLPDSSAQDDGAAPDATSGEGGGPSEAAADAPSADAPTSLLCSFGANTCPAGTYCKVAATAPCAAGKGVCAPTAGCRDASDVDTFYCACGGLFATECAALTSGGGLDTLGCAGLDAGFVQCGYLYCARRDRACVVHQTAGTYECVDTLALGCVDSGAGEPACPCTKNPCDGGASASSCQELDGGGVGFTCR